VTEEAESDCRALVRRTLRHSPDAYVAVTGCYAQTGVDALTRVPGIDLIVGNQYKMQLPDVLPPPSALTKRPAPHVLHRRRIDRSDFVLPAVGDYDSTRANLKIQDGCSFMCSFCIIPFARGPERSRRPDDVVREAEALVRRSHRELVLTGVNIGQYEADGCSLLRLIQRLERIEGLDRIRISSIEPTTVTDDLLAHMADSEKLCPYLHIPLQSGSDEILNAMNRRYTVRDYRDLIERALRIVPELGLGTDLLVGFPGENERAFEQTYTVASDLPFAYFHVFSYSKRRGTAAVKLADHVIPAVIRRRSRLLASLSRSKRLKHFQRYLGKTLSVLFESRDEQELWTGLTDNYIRVGVRSPERLENCLKPVVVTGVTDGLAIGSLVS
jgi:threonylcarbamoyladenosine tRNA methylthiotransferase MtaB